MNAADLRGRSELQYTEFAKTLHRQPGFPLLARGDMLQLGSGLPA